MNRLHDRKMMRTVGLVCLLLASLSRWFLHPTATIGPSLFDGLNGLLYGMSIGCMLLSLRRPDRNCSV